MTPDVQVLHNPRCSKSRAALAAADSAGVVVDVVRYLDEPLDAAALRSLLAKLEDPPAALVRRGEAKAAGVAVDELTTAEDVIAVLSTHPQLMERPVLVRGDRAIIGRPTERAEEFLRA
ncbi:MAG: ArsC/Spx/MgsR family protein [Desertimonas sp.]